MVIFEVLQLFLNRFSRSDKRGLGPRLSRRMNLARESCFAVSVVDSEWSTLIGAADGIEVSACTVDVVGSRIGSFLALPRGFGSPVAFSFVLASSSHSSKCFALCTDSSMNGSLKMTTCFVSGAYAR